MPEIVAVNRSLRRALTDNDVTCAITTFLDQDGDETEEPSRAVVAVGQFPDQSWFTVDLREFDEVEAN